MAKRGHVTVDPADVKFLIRRFSDNKFIVKLKSTGRIFELSDMDAKALSQEMEKRKTDDERHLKW